MEEVKLKKKKKNKIKISLQSTTCDERIIEINNECRKKNKQNRNNLEQNNCFTLTH